MAYLELQNLQRNFGAVRALDGIEIALGEGEFLSLLGPSGCGKTTALRLVAGFDRPDGGAIVVDGKDLTNVPPNKRDMGMVFQAYSLFPNMTARQNVEYGLKIRGKDKTRAARAACRSCSSSSASAMPPTAIRISSRAACSSASRSHARSRSSRACCCSTSRCRRSTRRCACSCARRSAASSSSSGSRRCTSRTTRRRRSRSPTTSR